MKPQSTSRSTSSRLFPLTGTLGLAALAAVCAATVTAVPTRPALACGWESATSCAGANAAADEARWMLKRVVAAVQTNEPRALDMFTRGQGGFRSFDIYVFCIGPDGHMSAHPDPRLKGQDARALRDPNGKAFAAEMLDRAKEGTIIEVQYLYPKLGSDLPVPKTSYVTKVKDQVCGVGTYDE